MYALPVDETKPRLFLVIVQERFLHINGKPSQHTKIIILQVPRFFQGKIWKNMNINSGTIMLKNRKIFSKIRVNILKNNEKLILNI